MNEINRKSIFMTGLRNKVSYVFTNKDLKEVETIIDFYEKQLKQRDEIINEVINLNCNVVKMIKEGYSQEQYSEYIKKAIDILQKYKGDNNE